MPDMERFLWICLAGAAGTGARYLVSLWAVERFGAAFPYGTLVVNLAGCFLIAFLMEVALSFSWSPTLRTALTVGFLGGLTTYSSFNHETTRMFQNGAVGLAGLNAVLTIGGAVTVGWLGFLAARQLIGH